MFHFSQKKEMDKLGYMAFKTGMSKAYDKWNGTFLELLMVRMGFNSYWVQLVQTNTWVFHPIEDLSTATCHFGGVNVMGTTGCTGQAEKSWLDQRQKAGIFCLYFLKESSSWTGYVHEACQMESAQWFIKNKWALSLKRLTQQGSTPYEMGGAFLCWIAGHYVILKGNNPLTIEDQSVYHALLTAQGMGFINTIMEIDYAILHKAMKSNSSKCASHMKTMI
ncbi:hypothetical protein FEM48_Zijuj07G0057200 [Ziziphus jujuba var. spinosa]|uniref:Uncharacterized protein n=1 Tax=Ziziphus jujuba var. spinosa TaxID=714518 RepID=A0A978V2T3_ZIZJJ|nr:hypothetical protein FEM48_Zijuj07G0057200 [Ziziphus jujuba var. spinosa]